VLYGPNDLGKSSLALAVKAALLLPGTSSVAEQYVPWQDPDQEPEVVVTFEAEDELWKLTRRFTSADVTLEHGDKQGAFRPAAKGKKVDERLRGLLSWGVPESVRGLPTTFLTTALLSAQSEVDAVFSRGLDDDADPSGQAQLSKVLTSLSRDPLVVRVHDAAQDEVDTVFMESGTMHVFAISGLHIALIAGVIVALLRAVRLPRRWCGLIAVPLIWFYVAATGWQTSAIRSALMSTVVIGTWNRPAEARGPKVISATRQPQTISASGVRHHGTACPAGAGGVDEAGEELFMAV
jgi:hypothetical protein